MSVGDPAVGFNYSLLSIFLQLCWAARQYFGASAVCFSARWPVIQEMRPPQDFSVWNCLAILTTGAMECCRDGYLFAHVHSGGTTRLSAIRFEHVGKE
jgi:hypothetical protein